MDCTIYVAKTKALISFGVTAKLMCVFVFAYAKSLFSHDAAHYTVCSPVCIIAPMSNYFLQTLARKAPNTTIADFANTVDPDETAHNNEPCHLDLQCWPSSL